MTTSSSSEPALVSDRRLTIMSIVLLLGAVTSILDTTIVNIALPQLRVAFDASVADTQWVSAGYLLALAGVIPLTGWAAERFGARRVWITAVALFLLGSVLCGIAWNLPSLIGFRVMQGIGGGMVLPLTMTILTQAAGPARIGRAMAAIMLPAQLAPILGPVVGGTIIDSLDWHWLFFVNVPLCILALAFSPALVGADARDRTRRLDLPGFLLLTPGLIALAWGISQATTGFGDPRTWVPIAAGSVLIALFAVYSLRTKRIPLVDVRVFGTRSFGLSSVMMFVSGFSTFAAMFLLPAFYQLARGDSAFTTGLLLIPQGLGTIAFILANRHLAPRVDTRWIVGVGVVLTMIGTLPFVFTGATGNDALLLVGQFVRGIGIGASSLPIMTLAFAGLSRAEIPRASTAFNVVQRVGAPFGVTVVAVILDRLLANGGSPASAFNGAYIWVLAFSVVPLVLTFFLPKPVATPAPEKTPETAVDSALATAE